MTEHKNPYGYGLKKSEMNALRWANKRVGNGGLSFSFFIVREGWKHYSKMGRNIPTKTIKGLFEKGMVYKDEFGSIMLSNRHDKLEAYKLTERAVHVLAKHGGYRLPDGQLVEMKK